MNNNEQPIPEENETNRLKKERNLLQLQRDELLAVVRALRKQSHSNTFATYLDEIIERCS